MKSKLADIQNNKLFLEKKISEYERKLNELKGINTENHGHHSGRGQHSSSIHNNKINTLTNAILERVIKEAKKWRQILIMKFNYSLRLMCFIKSII